jgi:hypothetical protein
MIGELGGSDFLGTRISEREIDEFLRRAPWENELTEWLGEISQKQTRIEVSLTLDAQRATNYRSKLDALFRTHQKSRSKRA